MRLVSVAAAVVLVFGLFDCSSARGGETCLTGADNGGEIKLELDDTVRIKLRSCPTCGYGWYTDETGPGLKAVGNEVAPRETSPGQAGGYADEIWTFKAASPGDTTLRLLYYRKWMGKESAEEKFEVKVHVSDKEPNPAPTHPDTPSPGGGTR